MKQAQAAYDYAQNFYQRQLGLRASSAISANDLENARSSRDQAQATLKSAQDKLRQYRAGNRPQEIARGQSQSGTGAGGAGPRPNWTCTIPCSPPLLTVR